MKITAIVLAASIMSTQASAYTAEQIETCTALGNLAQEIMLGRQSGLQLSQMLTISDVPLIQELVVAAFKQPFMTYPDNKNEQIRSFRDIAETACFGSVSK